MKRIAVLVLLSFSLTAHAQGMMKSIGGSSGSSSDSDQSDTTEPVEHKYKFYVGADLQNSRLSVSDSASFNGVPVADYTSKFWDARIGYRVLKAIGVEFHYGFPDQDANDSSHYKVRNYYGLFVVPTANVFHLFEIAFPVGYTNGGVTALDSTGAPVDKHLNSVAYGANIEFPIRVLWQDLPNIRIGGGGTVYYQRSDAREYGFHFGLRYDFGFGTASSS